MIVGQVCGPHVQFDLDALYSDKDTFMIEIVTYDFSENAC